MKRYLLFMGTVYYPGGGWHDFAGDYEDVKEAVNAAYAEARSRWHGLENAHRFFWAHVYDSSEREVKEIEWEIPA